MCTMAGKPPGASSWSGAAFADARRGDTDEAMAAFEAITFASARGWGRGHYDIGAVVAIGQARS